MAGAALQQLQMRKSRIMVDYTCLISHSFTHYFPERPWQPTIEKIYLAIGKQWDAPKPINGEQQPKVTLDQFTVIITCEDPKKLCQEKGTASFAITDVKPLTKTHTPSITICPLFFNSDRTRNHLDTLVYLRNPGRRQPSWCKVGEKFKYFEVAGHTILHELTHLNQAGAKGGLDSHPADPQKPNGEQTEGTEDANQLAGYSKDPVTAARQLHTRWEKVRNARPTPPRNQWPAYKELMNAESYAAAALEWVSQIGLGR